MTHNDFISSLTTAEITMRRDNLLEVARNTTDAEHRAQLFTSADGMTDELNRRATEDRAATLRSYASAHSAYALNGKVYIADYDRNKVRTYSRRGGIGLRTRTTPEGIEVYRD